MECLWLDEKYKYDGSQIKPLSNYLKYGVLGDSVVSWVGPCELCQEHIMDGEDLRSGARIAGDHMLHFVLELFQYPLSAAVVFQRLMGEILMDQIPCQDLKRKGDDIYQGEKKLNISIATNSSRSSLIHFGVNVTNGGTPVPTCSLTDFGITDSKNFALNFMENLKTEVMSMKQAQLKVRGF